MKKFIKKLGVLSALIITPLTLASFNKPTFAMESNSNTSIQSELNSFNEKAEDLNGQLNNLRYRLKDQIKLCSESIRDFYDIRALCKLYSNIQNLNDECRSIFKNLNSDIDHINKLLNQNQEKKDNTLTKETLKKFNRLKDRCLSLFALSQPYVDMFSDIHK